MTPEAFIAKWKAVTVSERAGAQSHFNDLCELDLIHKKLATAVFAAYGWPPDLSDDDLLARLLALNVFRAAAEAAVKGAVSS